MTAPAVAVAEFGGDDSVPASSALGSPEVDLLLALTAPLRNPDRLRACLDRDLQWWRFGRLAGAHGVLGQAGLVLDGLDSWEAVPPEVRRRLEACRDLARLRDRAAVVRNGEILSAIRAAGVDTILLKGAGLAERLYDEAAERASGDLDLLVRKSDLPAAGEALEAMGFLAFRPEWFRSAHFHIPYFHRGQGRSEIVELHWDVTWPDSPVRFDVASWWNRSRPLTLRAGEVRVPPDEDELVYLSHHAFNRGVATLHDLADLARLCARTRLPVEEIVDTARRCRAERFLVAGLRLASAFWGIREPVDLGEDRFLGRWPAHNLLAPETVIEAGGELWSAYRPLAYWSLLPSGTGRPGLLGTVLRSWRDVPPDRSGAESGAHRLRRLLALAVAPVLCALPRSLFPAVRRRSAGRPGPQR